MKYFDAIKTNLQKWIHFMKAQPPAEVMYPMPKPDDTGKVLSVGTDGKTEWADLPVPGGDLDGRVSEIEGIIPSGASKENKLIARSELGYQVVDTPVPLPFSASPTVTTIPQIERQCLKFEMTGPNYKKAILDFGNVTDCVFVISGTPFELCKDISFRQNGQPLSVTNVSVQENIQLTTQYNQVLTGPESGSGRDIPTAFNEMELVEIPWADSGMIYREAGAAGIYRLTGNILCKIS